MGVQHRVGVAEDLQVDPPERGIGRAAGPFDGLAEAVEVLQVGEPARPGQVGEPLHARTVGQQDRVPGQELHVPDHREPGLQPPEDGGVLPAQRAADAVGLPVVLVVDHGPMLTSRVRRAVGAGPARADAETPGREVPAGRVVPRERQTWVVTVKPLKSVTANRLR